MGWPFVFPQGSEGSALTSVELEDGGPRDPDDRQDHEHEKHGDDVLDHAAILAVGVPTTGLSGPDATRTAYARGMARSLVVKVTCGAESPERLSQALTVAATAVASGVPVSLWLTGDAVWLAVPGRVPDLGLEHAVPLADLVAAVLEGGTTTVCTQCATRRDLTADDLAPGVRIAGAAAFVQESLAESAQALVY
jgi:predicted peroxiredoxin